jgi:hypothetical protein
VKFAASQVVPTRPETNADPSAILVDAPQGKRVAVLRTGNANITVVWLY